MDSVFAVGISLFILYLAYDLFRHAVPVLVDGSALPADSVERAIEAVRGVRAVRELRSRHTGDRPAVDVTIIVDPELSTVEAHRIADAVEADLHAKFEIGDVVVHVEPDELPDEE